MFLSVTISCESDQNKFKINISGIDTLIVHLIKTYLY